MFGFLLTLRAGKSRYRVVHWILAGVFVAHIWVIQLDWRVDPTDHNLLPFEFVFLGIMALPGYAAAKAAQLVDRFSGAG